MVAVLAVVGGLLAACSAPAPQPPTADWAFEAARIHVHDSTDGVWGVGEADEPYVVNVAFRVTIGVAGSAKAWPVRGATYHDLAPGEGANLTGNQKGTASFPGLKMIDVEDVLRGQPLEVVGVWSWVMEEDILSLGGMEAKAATILQDLLNRFLAGGSLPESTSEWVRYIVDKIGVFGALQGLAVQIGFFGGGDDPIKSRVFVGLPVRGALGDVVDAAAAQVTFPGIDLPGAIPPSINGGSIGRLGNPSLAYMSNRMKRGNGDYTVSWRWTSPSGWGSTPTPTTTPTEPTVTEPECIPDRLDPTAPPICPI
ncbi:hypothetical protein [Dermatobacter hominis]|uniref:hypothetical protein n=1 Tax=Dermatobacter hominis TaxID=2884263 RepID=UPI001D0F5035|nr:hypothetical protein [Dermatobacter hominis]UDY37048.1 hypothetical protein LH044_05800 [Dermatobacter hominis]